MKAAAIHTLGAAAMYGGASESAIEEIMDDLLDIIESDGTSIGAEDSGEVVTAACEEWAFLGTLIENMEEKTEAAIDAFVEQLESSDTSVLVAAGETIALLFERSYTPRESGDESASDEEDEEGIPIDSSMVKRYEVYRQKGQLEHKISELASLSTKRISRKDRKVLHKSFSDILTTIEHPDRGPRYQNAINEETGERYGSRLMIRFHDNHKHTRILINTWELLHKLQALRRILGSGLTVHILSNPIMHKNLP